MPLQLHAHLPGKIMVTRLGRQKKKKVTPPYSADRQLELSPIHLDAGNRQTGIRCHSKLRVDLQGKVTNNPFESVDALPRASQILMAVSRDGGPSLVELREKTKILGRDLQRLIDAGAYFEYCIFQVLR